MGDQAGNPGWSQVSPPAYMLNLTHLLHALLHCTNSCHVNAMHCMCSVQVVCKTDKLKPRLLQTAFCAGVACMPPCHCQLRHALQGLMSCDCSLLFLTTVCCCRHFDVSTTGMLEEVKEGLALAFLEKMVSRDELWITATVSAYCVFCIWQLNCTTMEHVTLLQCCCL